MRFIVALVALLLVSLPPGGNANASPEGKRVMLLGTANTNPYIGDWTSTFTQVRHPGRNEGHQPQLEL